ncbi:MAG: hypothetical protein K0S81_2686, partial [Rhodospirillales bacterium]|nr:hypothetical protein [Rhodospirillales bacterium]
MQIPFVFLRRAAPRRAAPAVVAALVLLGCASAGRPLPITPGEPLGLGTFAVTPPPGVDWKGSELGDAREGRVALFAREFTPTHTLFAASVPDVVRPAMQAEYGAKMVELGPPTSVTLVEDGGTQCTYQYQVGNEPSAGR